MIEQKNPVEHGSFTHKGVGTKIRDFSNSNYVSIRIIKLVI